MTDNLEYSAEVRRQTESYLDYIIDDTLYPPEPHSPIFIQNVWEYADYELCPEDASEEQMKDVDKLITFYAKRYIESPEYRSRLGEVRHNYSNDFINSNL